MATERRSSMRITVNISVKIFGVNRHGQAFSEDATLINLSRHGACLVTSQVLDPGQTVLFETPMAGIVDAEVKWTGNPDRSNLRSVGVYCQQLSAAFGHSIPSLQPDV